jgi:hypothetical protein
MSEVLSRHPGEDGWCVFSGAGTWANTCAWARGSNDFRRLVVQYGSDTVMGMPSEMPPNGISYDSFHSDYEYLALDDSYCLENGWLDQSRFRYTDVYDSARMNDISEEECALLEQEFPDLNEKSFDFYGREGNTIGNHTSMRLHAAWKCAMGGLQCDIANCIYTYCLLDDGFIGHGLQCRSNWMPDEDLDYYWSVLE